MVFVEALILLCCFHLWKSRIYHSIWSNMNPIPHIPPILQITSCPIPPPHPIPCHTIRHCNTMKHHFQCWTVVFCCWCSHWLSYIFSDIWHFLWPITNINTKKQNGLTRDSSREKIKLRKPLVSLILKIAWLPPRFHQDRWLPPGHIIIAWG